MPTVRIGSLYTGIGGLDLGILAAYAEAGISARVEWNVEIDPFCDRVLRARFPETKRYRDVRE